MTSSHADGSSGFICNILRPYFLKSHRNELTLHSTIINANFDYGHFALGFPEWSASLKTTVFEESTWLC